MGAQVGGDEAAARDPRSRLAAAVGGDGQTQRGGGGGCTRASHGRRVVGRRWCGSGYGVRGRGVLICKGVRPPRRPPPPSRGPPPSPVTAAACWIAAAARRGWWRQAVAVWQRWRPQSRPLTPPGHHLDRRRRPSRQRRGGSWRRRQAAAVWQRWRPADVGRACRGRGGDDGRRAAAVAVGRPRSTVVAEGRVGLKPLSGRCARRRRWAKRRPRRRRSRRRRRPGAERGGQDGGGGQHSEGRHGGAGDPRRGSNGERARQWHGGGGGGGFSRCGWADG